MHFNTDELTLQPSPYTAYIFQTYYLKNLYYFSFVHLMYMFQSRSKTDLVTWILSLCSVTCRFTSSSICIYHYSQVLFKFTYLFHFSSIHSYPYSKPLRLSIYIAIILDLFFFHIIVWLPYIRTVTSNVSWKNPNILKLQIPSINQRPNSAKNFSPTHHFFITLCLICTRFIQNTPQVFKFGYILQSDPIQKNLIL